MKKYFIIIILCISILTGIVLVVSQQSKTQEKTKPVIVTSFYPLYFFATEIAGDNFTVVNLTPSGVEPHDYEPTAKDIATLQRSKVIIINGLGFEPWFSKLESSFRDNNIRIVNTSDSLSLQEIETDHGEDEHHHDGKDPHVWLSPALAKKQAENILQAISAVDPQNKSYYQANAQNLFEQFDSLDKEYRDRLSFCEQKNFVVSHAAFGYLADQYGLTQTAIAGISPEEEPSAQKMAQIADFAKEHNVTAIFFETLVSPKLSETIAKEIGAKTLVLDPIEGLSENRIKQGDNYFTLMNDNLSALQEALQCKQ